MKKPYILGLTGSIGMGKSTTSRFFQKAGVPVWDADATVHALYSPGGDAVFAISRVFPDAILDGGVDRGRLKSVLAHNPGALAVIEEIVHPLTTRSRRNFVAENSCNNLILLDIPLLFETGADQECDGVLVVSAPPELQRARVLERGTMTAQDLDLILSRQMSDREKRARADFVIETLTLEQTAADVQKLISRLTSES